MAEQDRHQSPPQGERQDHLGPHPGHDTERKSGTSGTQQGQGGTQDRDLHRNTPGNQTERQPGSMNPQDGGMNPTGTPGGSRPGQPGGEDKNWRDDAGQSDPMKENQTMEGGQREDLMDEEDEMRPKDQL